MSGKKNDILTPLESLIDEENRKNVSKAISLLEGQVPRIKIDREYQRTLKESLILPKKQKIFLKMNFPWFAFMSSIGVISTCFIAAFGLYNMWSSSREFPSSGTHTIKPSNTMYSEEKAERFSGMTSPVENTGEKNLWEKRISNTKMQIDAASFKAEKWSIDTEITDIQNNIMNTDMTTSSQKPPSAELPEIMRSVPKEVSSTGNPTETGISDIQAPILSISPSIALSNSLASSTSFSYPSSMKVYSKDTLWTSSEISNRSWSGIIEREFATEKYTIIAKKYNSLALWRKLKASALIYLPMTKISSDTSEFYYLVPALEYTFEWWEKITLPLIRWYKYNN